MESNVPLAPLTTFGIGGPARYFCRVTTVEELRQSLDDARDKNLRVQIFGGGSNVLVRDEGFNGLVIKIELPGIVREGDTLVAGAGESWDGVVARAVHEGLWGIENLSGIPGTVGGAVVGSIGAYGQAAAQTVAWVEVLLNGERVRLNNSECGFGYRMSAIAGVVVRAAFALTPHGAPEASYVPELAGGSLADIRRAILATRAGKFPRLAEEGTAGSFFKNPILPPGEAKRLQERYPGLPVFSMPEASGVKIPLAWLLDKVLGLKGFCVGGARLYERQPLVIAAKKGCSARDVEHLARAVEEMMEERFGIAIEREVKTI